MLLGNPQIPCVCCSCPFANFSLSFDTSSGFSVCPLPSSNSGASACEILDPARLGSNVMRRDFGITGLEEQRNQLHMQVKVVIFLAVFLCMMYYISWANIVCLYVSD